MTTYIREHKEGYLEIFFENLGKSLIICFSKFYKLTAIFLYKLFFSNLRVRMKGIAISPHILTLKPEPFTPLKRLGTPQTPVKNEENLFGFSFCAFGTIIRNIILPPCHSERKFLRSKN